MKINKIDIFNQDEHPRKDIDLANIKIKPVFKSNGTVNRKFFQH